ncbi:hypothetical protein [Bradyrhizobium forestalis]|uniref:hypothetical protein n=1 Tax=Bradyrhizobium forestalis TaxID=1419263 RepID=UPI0011AF1E27|nr:hypothetical protein [Bradyrhizobium forestalis]
MIEIVRDAATAFSVIEQGTLLDVHAATTRSTANGPCEVGVGLVRSGGKNRQYFTQTRNTVPEPTFRPEGAVGRNVMYDVRQWATAMLAIFFTVTLLIEGRWFIAYRLQHEIRTPIAAATLPP